MTVPTSLATVKAVGPRLSLDEITAAAGATALEHGMTGLTYRRVAEHVGTSDRMVVYYLPTKDDLIRAAVGALSTDLQTLLGKAFGDARREPDELARAAWPVLTTPSADRVFVVFLEILGLAARTQPYTSIAAGMLQAWADWVTERTAGSTPAVRRRRALGLLAQLDGLLVMRHTLGARAADDAARALGILPSRR